MDGIILKKKKETALNKFRITIEADENDGDYVYETTEFPQKDIDDWVVPILYLNQIDGWGDLRSRSNTPKFSDDIEEALGLLIPYGEYGVYSVAIKSFEFIDEKGEVYNVTLDEAVIRSKYPEAFI